MTRYWRAPEVEEIARKLIPAHHRHLVDVPITFVFRDAATKNRGRTVLARARKTGGLNAHLVALARDDEATGDVDFFVIEVAHDMWELMTPETRTALVDHELCHLDVEIPETTDKSRKLVLRAHNVEEFTEVIKRHGLWRPSIAQFAEAAAAASAQPTLEEGATGNGDGR